MLNYMLLCIQTKGYIPKYYSPANGKCIQANDVARFFGWQVAQSLQGNPSIKRCWLMRESLDAIGTCMESMPKNAFEDMYCCLHFDNNQDVDDGDE